MKKGLILLCLFAFTACTQCSNSKGTKSAQDNNQQQVEKTIKTIIIHANYSPEPITIGDKHYTENFQWLYESYCYKLSNHYSDFSYPYKGDIVDGKLIAKVYKKDDSFIEIPLTTPKETVNLMRSSDYNRLRVHIYIPYSGEEVRLEVRRVNKDKGEDVLLFEKQIEDLTGSWEEAEGYTNIPNGGGFRKVSQCHRTSGVM